MDREHARRNIDSALIAASIALGVFALTFIVAMVYVG
jgi:uncharacterized membrane protein (DUF485 family)